MVKNNNTAKNLTTLYECPICKKTYKTLGWFKRHSKQNHGGVLPYSKKIVIKERDLQALIMDTMKQVLGSMDFKSSDFAIKRIRKDAKENNRETIPAFAEYKEKMKNGGIELIHVPIEELHHIYNVMV